MRLALTVAIAFAGSLFVVGSIGLVPICHYPGPVEDPFGHPVTLFVPPSAVPKFLARGDTLGACGSQPTPSPRPTPRPTPTRPPRPSPTIFPSTPPRPRTAPPSPIVTPSPPAPDITPPATDA